MKIKNDCETIRERPIVANYDLRDYFASKTATVHNKSAKKITQKEKRKSKLKMEKGLEITLTPFGVVGSEIHVYFLKVMETWGNARIFKKKS